MKYLPHQIKFSNLAYIKLAQYRIVYIQGKPRSGKTPTALRTAELSKLNDWLILCPKNAIKGWEIFLKGLDLKGNYYVTNYHQVYNKAGNLKLDSKDYKGLILDEAHNLGTFPKPSKMLKAIRKLVYNYPTIYVSGTAITESPSKIFHQLWLTRFNPIKFSNFYRFHSVWGVPYYIKAGGRDINMYDKTKPELLDEIVKFSIYMTQQDAGIKVQAEDKVHYIELDKKTREIYNTLQEDRYIVIDNIELVGDSTMALRVLLHMLEGGVTKVNGDYILLGNIEKVRYILDTFGDTEDIGIMCNYVGERKLLNKYFKNANIYSSTSHAEGVNLSHLKHFIIYSSGYSGTKHIQRRERIINTNGSNTTTVNHLIVKNAISEQVYKAVNKKLDFNNSTYERTKV